MDASNMELFSRQIPFLGEERQDALSKAKVAVIGAGGLGSFVSSLLVRAGVGVVRIIDPDVVELSNLPRTAIYRQKDAGKSKAFILAERLSGINPDSRVDGKLESFNAYSAEKLLAGFGVVVDCTDSMEARYAINKFCIKNKIPWVYGAVLRDEGFSATFAAGGRPCFNCVYHDKTREAEKTGDTGVIGTAVAMVASWQATEVIKIVTGLAVPNYGKLYRFRLSRPGFEILALKPWDDCDLCGKDLLSSRLRDE